MRSIINILEKREKPTEKMFRRRNAGMLLVMNALIWFLVGDVSGTMIETRKTSWNFENPTPIALVVEQKKVEVIEEKIVEKKVTLPDLIHETFPEERHIALAVAKAESKLNPHTTNIAPAQCKNGYPNCLPGEYKGECSIGIYQINLAENGCKGKRVTDVPGETIDDDIEWLKNEQNNLKIARAKYDGRKKTWLAWGAFTNGAYRKWLTN